MNIREKLFESAQRAAANAYCPYSRFAVGAAVYADDGRIYCGCNVENVSYPVGTCAESGAIAAMVCGGGRKIIEMIIFADANKLVSPCGACRQRIKEFSAENTLVHLADAGGIRKTFTIDELLPFSF